LRILKAWNELKKVPLGQFFFYAQDNWRGRLTIKILATNSLRHFASSEFSVPTILDRYFLATAKPRFVGGTK